MPAKSKSQQRLFGMVHAYQKGKLKHAPASVKHIAKHISEEDAEHFAKTRHEGLPETKKAEVITMTRYEQGFLTKCAEYGIDVDTAMSLMHKVANLTPKNVGKLLFNNFAKTDRSGLHTYGRRAEEAKEFLKRLGTLTPKVESNLNHISSLAKDVEEVAPLSAPLRVNYRDLGRRLREHLMSHEHASPDFPRVPLSGSSDTPIGRIFQSLGFKGVHPKGTVVTVNPS